MEELPGLRPLQPRPGLLAELRLGEEFFYRGETAEAGRKLEAAWKELKARPELLPSAPAGRAEAYRALLTLYRLRSSGGGDAEAVGRWLAVRMPDQVPSVRLVPPRDEAALSKLRDEALAAKGRLHLLHRGDMRCSVFVDGRRVGESPISGLELPRGEHALWLVCGQGLTSWVRRVAVVERPLRLEIDPGLEGDLAREGRTLRLRPGLTRERRHRAAAWVARLSGADAALRLPVGAEKPEVVHPGLPFVRRLPSRELCPPPRGLLKPPGWWRPRAAAWTGGAALAAALAGGTFVVLHNRRIDELNEGWDDTRDEARRLELGAWASFAGAGLLALTSGAFLIWHGLDKGPAWLRNLPSRASSGAAPPPGSTAPPLRSQR